MIPVDLLESASKIEHPVFVVYFVALVEPVLGTRADDDFTLNLVFSDDELAWSVLPWNAPFVCLARANTTSLILI